MNPWNLRSRLRTILLKWESGAYDERAVHFEAEAISDEMGDFPIVPRQDVRSIGLEVLSQLDILNHQWVIKADIPAIYKFLETEPGHELEAWKKWESYWQGIDWKERRESLKNNPFYSLGMEFIPE